MAYLYVSNDTKTSPPSYGAVFVVDTATDSVAATIHVGSTPSAIAITPDFSTVYVVNQTDGTVSVIDTSSNTISATISVVTPMGNNDIAITPDGTEAYVASSSSNIVAVIDTSTNVVSHTISVSNGPCGVAFTPDGSEAYVTCPGNQTVRRIDVATHSIVGSAISVPSGNYDLAVTPNGAEVCVMCTDPGSACVSIIDTSTHALSATIFLTSPTGGGTPSQIAIRPDGIKCCVTNASSYVQVINLPAKTFEKAINIGGGAQPYGIAFADAVSAYVADYSTNKLTVINTVSDTISSTLSLSTGAIAFGLTLLPKVSPMTSTYAAPQGRLTLTSNTPVMTADATGTNAENVYYDPYVGNILPIYDGSNMASYPFSELKMALNTTNQTSGNIHDLFVFLDSSVVTIGAGPAWSTPPSSTQPGSRGTASPISQIDGLWTNTNNITLKNGSTNYGSINAGEATYVGSVYMVANGQTGVQFKPAAAAGGTNNFIGIWNAYNRVHISSMCTDSNTSWTYATNTWRPLDGASGNTKNRISYLDGLGQSFAGGRTSTIAYNATNGDGCEIGVVQNSTTTSPNKTCSYQSGNSTGIGAMTFTVEDNFPPVLGLSYLQAMENSPNATTTTFAFNGGQTGLLFRGEF